MQFSVFLFSVREKVTRDYSLHVNYDWHKTDDIRKKRKKEKNYTTGGSIGSRIVKSYVQR